uniref:DNA polymerase epsilon subunit 3 n=1 Tax=Acanthochromis polyacanthus TaxID=80966 RepID=A0A3Q1GDW5_9TELE
MFLPCCYYVLTVLFVVVLQLPDGVNVSKEARRAISQAASVFVLYATSCANNFAMKAKRKTLNAGDVMAAMEEMEFERFLEPLREALEGQEMMLDYFILIRITLCAPPLYGDSGKTS